MHSTTLLSPVIPLSLYIHFPWCVKKCPYCDFNSHAQQGPIPETAYIDALIRDLDSALPLIWGRPIRSIFMGGGTPSLFSPQNMDILLSALRARLSFSPHIEITMEANPGSLEHAAFAAYKAAGINRISLGVQSFEAQQLKNLGRIHGPSEAVQALKAVQLAGFEHYNVDLMYGLPHQTLEQALLDLKTACALNPTHLSWYQLTLEPNTPFYLQPPPIPEHDLLCDIEEAGLAFLQNQGFLRYEVSAFYQKEPCQHNLNYWRFGDYLGIGAGAHSKLTQQHNQTILRAMRPKHPKTYVADAFLPQEQSARWQVVPTTEIAFEYALNRFRLLEPWALAEFSQRTGLALARILPALSEAEQGGWIKKNKAYSVQTTPLGLRFLNDLVALFL